MEAVDVSFKHLLLEITEKLSMPVPKYDLTVDSSGQFSAYVDVEVKHGDNVTEIVRSWGSSASVVVTSEVDAARNSINTLRDQLGFNVRDTNFEELKFYKNIYNQLVEQYNVLAAKYDSLMWDYKFVKGCYNRVVDENERYCVEHSEIQQGLERVLSVIHQPATVVDVPGKGAAQEPSTGPE